MYVSTLLRSAWSGWISKRGLLPLFALFAGLLSPALVAAQASTADVRSVVVTAASNTSTYDAVPISGGTTVGGGIFAGTNFGSFDVNTGTLQLNGGTIQITEAPGETYNSAQLEYRVFPTSGPLSNYTAPPILLAETGFNPTTRVRTFSTTSATINLLGLVTSGGAGTTYNFDVRLRATDLNLGRDLVSEQRRATFTATGIPVFTPTLTNTTVLISPSNAANVSYDINNASGTNPFNGANLGSFDVNTGQLVLNGGTATTRENGPNTISSVTLYYRSRISTSGGGIFMPLALTQTGINTDASNVRTRTFALSNANQNLLAAAAVAGGYKVDVYLQASGVNTTTGGTFDITGTTNTADFTITGTPIATTIWTGGINDNWFDVGNWSNGLPNENVNAFIPNFNSGNPKPYPNIYSNVVRPPTPATTTIDPDGTVISVPATPGYDNRGSGNAKVRTITFDANSQLDRSITRLIVGRLDVFGDFNNTQGSFIQRFGTTISFKAQSSQTISGSTNGFSNVEIDGGANSIKTLTTSFVVKSGGSLKFINGILQTDVTKVSTNFVELAGAVSANGAQPAVPAAQVLGESETSFFRGFLTTTQPAPPGTAQNFSNIGLTLTFTGNDPGSVQVTRNNADNYPTTAFGGTTPKPGIRRIFGVQPANPNTNSGGLDAKLDFRYLTNELSNLKVTNNSNDFSGSVDQTKLSLYVSQNGGNTFSQLGRDANVNNVLTRTNVSIFATFTLSEQQNNPLPVELIAFAAKRAGADALLTWATASESGSAGFEVQVSADGSTFRKLGFVASQNPNSQVRRDYRYLDTEVGKAGLRYYRLRQVDVNGEDAFSPVQSVSFDGAALAISSFTASPNPFTDRLTLGFDGSQGVRPTRVVLLDLTGRVVREVRPTDASNGTATIDGLSSLSTGIYMARVLLADGSTKTVRVQKQ